MDGIVFRIQKVDLWKALRCIGLILLALLLAFMLLHRPKTPRTPSAEETRQVLAQGQQAEAIEADVRAEIARQP